MTEAESGQPETACMETECVLNRGALWAAMAALEDLGSRIDQSLARARERADWANDLSRLLSEIVAEFGTPALMARATAKQRELMADARVVTGMGAERATTATRDEGGQGDVDEEVQ